MQSDEYADAVYRNLFVKAIQALAPSPAEMK